MRNIQVKLEERERFFKALTPIEIDLLVGTYNVMCVAVEMTNNKGSHAHIHFLPNEQSSSSYDPLLFSVQVLRAVGTSDRGGGWPRLQARRRQRPKDSTPAAAALVAGGEEQGHGCRVSQSADVIIGGFLCLQRDSFLSPCNQG